MLHNMHAGGFSTGADTDISAQKLQQVMPDIMIAAAFNWTKWISNSKSSLLVECNSREPLKGLGVSKDLLFYCLLFHCTRKCFIPCPNEAEPSKFCIKNVRPNGTDISFHCERKILFQELWKGRLEWDDPLDSDIGREWSSRKSSSCSRKM